jgi:hypothetical protein
MLLEDISIYLSLRLTFITGCSNLYVYIHKPLLKNSLADLSFEPVSIKLWSKSIEIIFLEWPINLTGVISFDEFNIAILSSTESY